MDRARGVFVLAAFLMGFSAQAEVIEVKTVRHFDCLIGNCNRRRSKKYDYAIGMFYYADREMSEDPEWSPKIDALENSFNAASRESRYEDAGMAFLKLNTARANVDEIATGYDITEYPAYLLFRFGEPVSDRRLGYLKSDQITNFIDGNLEKDLKKAIERNKKLRKERIEERLSYGYYGGYWPPYYGPYGYPYGGVGYGGVGFSFGFGHHFGHHW